MISELITVTKPEDPKIVVLGVNSNAVSLKWDFSTDSGETIQSLVFKRKRPGDASAKEELIASRLGGDSKLFTMIAPFKDLKKYKALRPSELQIYNVQRDEEYLYILQLNYVTSGNVALSENSEVLVDVKGKKF